MNKRCQKDFLKFTHLIRVLGRISVILPYLASDSGVRCSLSEAITGSNFPVTAGSQPGQLVAIGLNAYALGGRREA